jgi:hypothetical protein
MPGASDPAPLPRFDPPGRVPDLDAAGHAAWSTIVSNTINDAIAGDPKHFANDAPRSRFFNETAEPRGKDAVEKRIEWVAFPRIIQDGGGTRRDRLLAADADRDVQDEYCEWAVTRRADDKITRVTFTSEPREYWFFLANRDPDRVLALYREHVSPAVTFDDLFPDGGGYDRFNRWNAGTIDSIMHLNQGANALGAEIELAAAATIVREKDGQVLHTEQALIGCSKYGDARRNSDPHIGGEVNAVARAGGKVTIADPVGLYIDRLDTAGWDSPDHTDPLTFWRFTRGTAGNWVRAVYEVPPDAGKDYVVGDVTILGEPIDFGSQIAEHILIRVTGVGTGFDPSKVNASHCRIVKQTGLPGIAAAGTQRPAPVEGPVGNRLLRPVR